MLRLLVLACLAFLAGASLSACGGGDGASSGASATIASAALPPRPEGRLTMCVQALRGAQGYEAEAVKRLGDAVSTVQTDARWPRFFPSKEQTVIDTGCPEEPAVPGVNFVEEPGYYRVYAFVALQPPFDPRFTQEAVRSGSGAGVEATAGLFVTPGGLCDQGWLVAMLKNAIGFDHSPLPSTTPAPAGPTATPCVSPG